MPLSIYAQLTNKTPPATRIRLSIANHSYVHPLGIAEDVLINVAGFLYPIDFMIIDDRKNEYIPIILGAPFHDIARATIKYETGIIELQSGRKRVHMTPWNMMKCKMQKKLSTNLSAPNNHVKNAILVWQARIKKPQEHGEGEEKRRNMASKEVAAKCKQQIVDADEFMKWELVLLSHSGIKLPPDKLKSWWYGPFTIKRFCQNGAVILINEKFGEMTVNAERLKHYHHDSKVSISNGYIILRDEAM